MLHLWRALAERDWDAVKTVVSDDCIFLDVKRLKGGLENENLADWANHDVRLLTNGVDVMYEHLVIYTSTNGEVTNNPIVSVHKVSDGKISLWKDYWDFNTIANAAWFQSSTCSARYELGFRRTGLV